VTIITASLLHRMCRIYLHGGTMYMLFLCMSHHSANGFVKLVFLVYFWRFFCKFCHNWRTVSKNLSAHIILVLNATFAPNLTFLGLLSPEISVGEKTVTHSPSLFHYPWTSVFRTEEYGLPSINQTLVTAYIRQILTACRHVCMTHLKSWV